MTEATLILARHKTTITFTYT